MFDDILQQAYVLAVNEAKMQKHQILTPEHILFSILLFEEGIKFITTLGGDVEEIKTDIQNYFDEEVPKSQENLLIESQDFIKLCDYSTNIALKMGVDKIELIHLLEGFFKLKDSFAVYYLLKAGIDHKKFEELKNSIYFKNEEDMDDFFDIEIRENTSDKINTKMLEKYTTDLTKLAKANKLDKIIGREKETQRTIEILLRKTKNNPIHVGNSGVGKTSIMYLLAQKVVNKEVPKKLMDTTILSLNIGSLLAGTRYRGDFEERTINLFEEITKLEKVIVYIDEVHSIVGAGNAENNSSTLANLLKPYFVQPNIKFVGSTTYEEYRKFIQKDNSLNRRFQYVDIVEPSFDDVFNILIGIRSDYEKYHNVSYSDDILNMIIRLADKYLKKRFFPDKAIDILDEVGARISAKSIDKKTKVSQKDVIDVFTKITGQKVVDFDEEENQNIKTLEKRLNKVVFGQEEAISKICDKIQIGALGLNDENKPLCQMLFVGKTGVGKTMVSNEVGTALNRPIVRFDMSEYQEKHAVAKLIGSPQGYVGYEEGGILVKEVSKKPNCILIFDEIEKAHKDIYNILLQVLDYGVLTENSGTKAYFNNCIIFLTSNAGASEVGKSIIGFGDNKISTENMLQSVNKVFAPEFRNRLDDIVVFNDLNKTTAEKIAKAGMEKLKSKLDTKNIKFKYTPKVLSIIGENGLVNDFGGREINRYIDEKIKKDIAKKILDEKFDKEKTLYVKVKNQDIFIDIV